MFRKSLLSLAAFVAVASAAIFHVENASAADPTSEAQTVFKFLENRDYSPRFDSDGDIVFEHEDNTFLIVFDRNDTQYYRILYINFWTLDDEDELKNALRAANRVNLVNKGAKVMVPHQFVSSPRKIEESPYVAVETFSNDAYEFSRTIPRSVEAIEAAALKFGVFMLATAIE